MNEKQKEWIDNASYYDLLLKWRFASSSPILEGETGAYFKETMAKRGEELSHDERVKVSKEIGW